MPPSRREEVDLPSSWNFADVADMFLEQLLRHQRFNILRNMSDPDSCRLSNPGLGHLQRNLVFLCVPVMIEEVEEDAFLDGEIPDGHVFSRG